MRGLFVSLVFALATVSLIGCGGQTGQQAEPQESPATTQTAGETPGETGSTPGTAREETTEQAVEGAAGSESAAQEEAGTPEGQIPEDAMGVLALQYQYINAGDFEGAYSLFAEQSQRQVSLAQYRAFFEANAPYSITDYSLSPAQDGSAAVDATFTVNSAAGAEQLQRTQQFVRENGEWRIVMRPEQVTAFTATSSPVSPASAEEKADQEQEDPPTPEKQEASSTPEDELRERLAENRAVMEEDMAERRKAQAADQEARQEQGEEMQDRRDADMKARQEQRDAEAAQRKAQIEQQIAADRAKMDEGKPPPQPPEVTQP